jgi:hypothetical protein
VYPKGLRWGVILPIALVVLAVLAIVWLDAAKGGEAKPQPLAGALGTPVRGTFVPPPPTPTTRPGTTPQARPTVPGAQQGDSASRDAKRRGDLLLLANAANQLKARDGSYPSTSGNVQTVCAFKSIDVGCKLRDVLGADPPVDPFNDPVKAGYWYSSDGTTAKVYAALEGDISDADKCETNDAELKKKFNVICLRIP